jgi:hypothetical protein
MRRPLNQLQKRSRRLIATLVYMAIVHVYHSLEGQGIPSGNGSASLKLLPNRVVICGMNLECTVVFAFLRSHDPQIATDRQTFVSRLFNQVTIPGQHAKSPDRRSESSLWALLDTHQLHFQHADFSFG